MGIDRPLQAAGRIVMLRLAKRTIWLFALSLMLALVAGIGVNVIPQAPTSSASSTHFGVEAAHAAKKKSKKKKKSHKKAKKAKKKPAKPKPKPNVPHRCKYLRAGGDMTLVNIPFNAGGDWQQIYRQAIVAKCVIDATYQDRSGSSVIRIGGYDINLAMIADSLILAKKRGVKVQVSMWASRNGSGPAKKLRAALGSNPRASSFMVLCQGSCLAGGRATPGMTDEQIARTLGIQHAKTTTVSRALGANGRPVYNVSFVGSANYTTGNTYGSWNSTQMIVGDAVVYGALSRYVDAMKWDRATPPFPTVRSRSGKYEVHFSPAKDKKDDPIYRLLKTTKCTFKVGKVKRRTVVRASAYKWSLAMDRYRREFKRLKKQGCDLGAILATTTRTNQAGQRVLPYRSAMSARLRTAGIPTYDSTRDMNGDGKVDLGTHDKSLVIDGYVGGRIQAVSVIGGRNWTGGGLLRNAEVMVVVHDRSTANVMLASWNRQRAKSVWIPCYSPELVAAAKRYHALDRLWGSKRHKAAYKAAYKRSHPHASAKTIKKAYRWSEKRALAPYKHTAKKLTKLRSAKKCEQTRSHIWQGSVPVAPKR